MGFSTSNTIPRGTLTTNKQTMAFRLAVVVALCACTYAWDFSGLDTPRADPAAKSCKLNVDETKLNRDVYQGGLILSGLKGILGKSCNVDADLLKKAELRYVKQLSGLLQAQFPDGDCNPKTLAKDVYQAFDKVSKTPASVKKIEQALYTKWCNGVAPSAAALANIATMKAALNLYGGNVLLNGVQCQC